MEILTTDSQDGGIGDPVIPQPLSNDIVASIEKRLTEEDFVKLKFLSKEWITREKWPTIHTFSQFILHLKDECVPKDEIVIVLIELLYIIQRYDLLKLLGSCQHTARNQERKLVNRFWKDWYERVESVEVDNVDSVSEKLLPHLKSKSYRQEILDELLEPLKELLGDQHTILNQLMNSFEVSWEFDFYYIRPVGTYGLCLIINNEKFPEPQVREGTAKDKASLINTFEAFDFIVKTKDDLTASQMKTWIMEVAEKNQERIDCFVCWILTHGSEGHIQGIDGQNLNIQQDVIQPFCKAAKTLADKPKLFFINACQGKDKQSYVEIPPRKEPEESLQTDNATRLQDTLPGICDYLVAVPTILGHAAYRSPTKGTWFVNAFVEAFTHYGDKEDILDVLVKACFTNMGKKSLLQARKNNEGMGSEALGTNSRCSRHIQELKDALNLDQWKSCAQISVEDNELFPIVQASDRTVQGPRKRSSPEIVVYEDPRKRKKIATVTVTTVKSGWKVKPEKLPSEHNRNEFNIRKAQHEVQKLAISGMNKLEKEEAKVALAVKLGAKPPKKKYYNYKELLALKKQEQATTEASLLLEKKKFPTSHRGGQKKRKDRNEVRAFDSQIGRFRNGVQMIKKNDLFRMKKARRKTNTRV